jgi:secondary thiamine-phosphate synthase enzyme
MELEVATSQRVDVVDVTDRVENAVPDDVTEGICHVFVQHTTAGVVVNENERRLLDDLERALETLVPRNGGYDHDAIDDNADAHLRAMLLGESVTVPIREGRLALGTWQSIMLVEGDGPRTRRLRVTVVE